MVKKWVAASASTSPPPAHIMGRKHTTPHQDFKYILLAAQFFGILPVAGVTECDVNHLKFKWCTVRVFYAVFLTVPTFMLTALAFYRVSQDETDAVSRFSPVMFYSSNGMILLIFLMLAKNWPEFMFFWDETESLMECQGSNKTKLRITYNIITFCVMLMAAAEHIMRIVSAYTQVKELSSPGADLEVEFFIEEYPYVFLQIPYNRTLAVLLKILSFLNTFAWNFLDVFIILMSIALADKFRQFNERVKWACRLREKCDSAWISIRMDFSHICRLCKRTDLQISNIIILSFWNNLYFLLVQLHSSLKRRETTAQAVYFFLSTALMLSRTIAVCLYGAKVNDESKKSLYYIHSLPSDSYSKEIHRLIEQIHTENIALTGKRFFRITRGLILKIAGTIVTYELFLLQYVNIAST